MGALCCHGNQSSNPISPKTLCSLSPLPDDALHEFDYNWPVFLESWHCKFSISVVFFICTLTCELLDGFDQIYTDTYMGQSKEMIRFWCL